MGAGRWLSRRVLRACRFAQRFRRLCLQKYQNVSKSHARFACILRGTLWQDVRKSHMARQSRSGMFLAQDVMKNWKLPGHYEDVTLTSFGVQALFLPTGDLARACGNFGRGSTRRTLEPRPDRSPIQRRAGC
jgi:hypothetical protein